MSTHEAEPSNSQESLVPRVDGESAMRASPNRGPNEAKPDAAPGKGPELVVLSRDAYELAMMNYGHIEQQASLAATKAALLVAAQALLGATYVSVAKDFGVFHYFSGTVLGYLFGVAGVCVLVGFLLSLFAIFPKSKPDSDADVLFFASIQTHFRTGRDYAVTYQRLSQAELDRQLLENIHGKACWLRRNFGLVRASIILTFVGASTTAVLMLLMSPELRSAA